MAGQAQDPVRPDERGSELVVGLVAPLGASATELSGYTQEALEGVGYRTEMVQLSHLLHGLDGPAWKKVNPPHQEDHRVKYYMDRGTELCEQLGRGDALALLSINEISRIRAEMTGDPFHGAARVGYVLRSLKRKKEVETLRAIYGDRFILVAGYASQHDRLAHLARAIARSHHDPNHRTYFSQAQALLDIDYKEQERSLGQNVSSVFPQADVFVPVDDAELAKKEIVRFIELLFGNTFHTPRPLEEGMFFAYSAAMRSASLSRQVGCALRTASGSVVSVGTNEVAAPSGGAYWPTSPNDARDHVLGRDPSDEFRRLLIADLIKRLSPWLRKDIVSIPVDKLVDLALAADDDKSQRDDVPHLDSSMAMDVIEYQRAVHAEMLAITDAVRRGVSTQDAVLFTTTFPCHNCAKHIVAAGISEVYYVEPYPKSLVADLYADSISVEVREDGKVSFLPFIGVAPRRYLELFSMTDRKTPTGGLVRWTAEGSEPRLGVEAFHNVSCIVRETQYMGLLLSLLEDHHLISRKEARKWTSKLNAWQRD